MDNSKVIIIIGLPGSGKSTFALNMTSHIIFDDFITTYYNGKVSHALSSDDKICLIDPRLCIPSIWTRYITKIEKYVDRSNIHLILFENNMEACLNNIKKRNDRIYNMENTIKEYHKCYDIDNYKEWQYSLMPIWK